MPIGQYPRGLIQKLVEEGASPEESFRGYRVAGGQVTPNVWQSIWGEVENELSLGSIEQGKALNVKPQAEDIQTMTTKRATGYLQRVTLIMTNRGGEALTRNVDLSTRELVSRMNAIRKAMTLMEEAMEGALPDSESFQGKVQLGFYQATYQMTPR